jgi:hypothetical protein
MSGPGRRKKVIIIVIILGRLALNNDSYSSSLNLSATLLPTVDDLEGQSYAADIGNAIDTFAAIVGDDPDNPDSFTQTELEAYLSGISLYVSI